MCSTNKEETPGGLRRRETVKILGLFAGGAAMGFLGRSAFLPSLNILDQYVAYGGGSSVEYKLDPSSGKPTIPLEEVWYFDLNHAFLRIDNNPQAFAMYTYKMGRIVIEANSFHMMMLAEDVSVDSFASQQGEATVVLTGNVTCDIAATTTNVKIGGREVKEVAPYSIVAQHRDKLGDSFSFTAFFQPENDVHYSVFGPSVTLWGKIKTGGVTIKPIRTLNILSPT